MVNDREIVVATAEQLWTKDPVTGVERMPALQAEFLEWLVSLEGDKGTVEEWCAEHGVSTRSTRRWKQDPRFRKEWEKAADDDMLGPSFLQPIIQNMWKRATDPSARDAVKAAETLFKINQSIRPPVKRIEITAEEQFAELSDAELAAFLDQQA